MRQQNITMQYCEPGNHAKEAEKAIQDFKNHFISTLSTTSMTCPVKIWDKLLPQTELCINHLRPYRPNPQISAYAGIHGGSHDFRAHPIAPAGTRILIHDKPTQRQSWAPHGSPGFYLGPAMKHYRCFHVWSTSTNTTRDSGTLAWFPEGFDMPSASITDLAISAIGDLHVILQQLVQMSPASANLPQPVQPSSVAKQLVDIVNMYNTQLPNPTTHSVSPLSFSETAGIPTVQPVLSVSVQPLPTHPSAEQRVIIATPEATLHNQQEQRVPSGASRPRMSFQKPVPRTYKQNIPQHDPFPDNLLINIANPTTTAPVSPALTTSVPSAFVHAALNLDANGTPLNYQKAKKSEDAPKWEIAEAEEWQRLLDPNIMTPIQPHQQPHDRKKDTAYYNPQVKQKDKNGEIEYRVRGTIGGDRINYDGPTSAQTAAMPVVKMLLNSVISDNSKWCTIDIKDYYLGTPLPRTEYVRVPLKYIPSAIIEQYHLEPFIHNGYILFEINMGMYGLPQAGLLAQLRLMNKLLDNDYHETNTPCLFRHVSNGNTFTLIVDDFGIKYTSQAAIDHLIAVLRELYVIKINWTGDLYIGFTIKFHRDKRKVHLSMPDKIPKLLERFGKHITKGADSPAIYTPPTYGNPHQSPTSDNTPLLSDSAAKDVQGVVGSVLYYARGVDATMLPAVNDIGSSQSNPTEQVGAAKDRLLEYAARFPNNELVLHACDMILHSQSDCSYLSRSNARSVAGGIFYLGDKDAPTKINGPIHTISSIIPVVVASVGEGEYGSAFLIAREGAMLRNILEDLGYPQPPTHILCDNKCAVGIANDTVTQKRTKSIDMQFHWLRDRVR